jgi:MerR family transcriptional regulator, repressor of the yfmOP operon
LGWLKIEDIARETGLTKRTIRYYEEMGLIKPSERSEGNIRLYTDEDMLQIKRMIDAREVLGFSLQELLQFLKLKESIEQHNTTFLNQSDQHLRQLELSEIAQALQEQVTMLENKMKKMSSFKAELEDLLEQVNHLQKDPHND